MRRVLILTGAAVMLYAAGGAVAGLGGKVTGVLIFLVVVLVAHDAVWMPLVLLAGRLLGRRRGDRAGAERYRGPVRVAVVVAAALTVATLPLVLGRGRSAGNPSALPLDYPRNLALVLLAVAAGTGIVLLSRKVSAIRRRRPGR